MDGTSPYYQRLLDTTRQMVRRSLVDPVALLAVVMATNPRPTALDLRIAFDEELRVRQRQWRRDNRIPINIRRRAWRRKKNEDPVRRAAENNQRAAYRKINEDAERAYNRQYYAAHKEQINARRAKRRKEKNIKSLK